MTTEELRCETRPAATGSALGSEDTRRQAGRRTFSFRTVIYSLVRPRRRQANRAADRSDHHVDYHSPATVFFAAGIVLLAAADAFMMIRFHDLGMHQRNGLVAALIQAGPGFYTAAKLCIASVCVLLLACLGRLRVYGITAQHLLPVGFVVYLAYLVSLLHHSI